MCFYAPADVLLKGRFYFYVFGDLIMNSNLSKEECIVLLRQVNQKENRYPKKSDFTEQEVARIKSLFGPWPRALEAAGITGSKETERAEKRARRKTRGN